MACPGRYCACVEAGGGVDTTAAIVGGIVAAHTGTGARPDVRGVPVDWIEQREPLPDWSAR